MYIIAGTYRRQRLVAPKSSQTRPTASRLREALFNICQGSVPEARFLDLFAGSGAIGFEALSRGAQSVSFIDSSKEAIQCIKQNATHLKVEAQCQILHGEVFPLLKWLEKQHVHYDLIYADPPYKTHHTEGYSQALIEAIDAGNLLAAEGTFFLEEDARHPPSTEGLKNLTLKSSRIMGHSLLMQFKWSSTR